jgi:hypothetical protein
MKASRFNDVQITLGFIQPGKPQQNGLNGKFGNEFLNRHLFRTLG